MRATVEQLFAERDQLTEDRDRLIDEAKDLMRERDDAIEYGDTEHEFAESLVKDLHAARNAARNFRELYAAEIDESIVALPFPWEGNNGSDRDGC